MITYPFPTPARQDSERLLPVIILADTSHSMGGGPLEELLSILEEFGTVPKADYIAQDHMDICIIGFGTEVSTILPFCSTPNYTVPNLIASGSSSMNKALEIALDTLQKRKDTYRSVGIQWYRPWLILCTDGKASDIDREAVVIPRLHEAITIKKLVYLPLAVGSHANKESLQKYYPIDTASKIVLSANNHVFREAFSWGNNIAPVSRSNNITDLPLPSTIVLPL